MDARSRAGASLARAARARTLVAAAFCLGAAFFLGADAGFFLGAGDDFLGLGAALGWGQRWEERRGA